MNSKKSKTPREKTSSGKKDPRQSTSSAPDAGTKAPEAPPAEPPARRKIGDGSAPDAASRPKGKKSDVVTVTIPHAFNLLVGNGETGGSQMFAYGAGITEMPREHAEHEYARAHGVEIQE